MSVTCGLAITDTYFSTGWDVIGAGAGAAEKAVPRPSQSFSPGAPTASVHGASMPRPTPCLWGGLIAGRTLSIFGEVGEVGAGHFRRRARNDLRTPSVLPELVPELVHQGCVEGRPSHRPTGSPIRRSCRGARVRNRQRMVWAPLRFRVAYCARILKIAPNTAAVIPFFLRPSRMRQMGISSEIVRCMGRGAWHSGFGVNMRWLLIYTDPETGRWFEQNFRTKAEAVAAQDALCERGTGQ